MNIVSFNDIAWGTDNFSWRAYLTSNGKQQVELDSITLDTTPPWPGWLGADLALWLKADTGTSTTTDGVALTTWSDQSWNSLDAVGWVSPTYLNNDTDSLNFNPVVDFNGSTQYLENLAWGAHSDSYFMVIVPDNTVEGTVSRWVPFGWDCTSGTLSSGGCGLPFAGMTLWSFTAALPDEVLTHALWSSANWRSAQLWLHSYEANSPMLLMWNENSSADGTDIYEKGLQINNCLLYTSPSPRD